MKKPNHSKLNDSLTFKLPTFEGPLDLLLHLIKANEMDIYDIPMADITAQYLASLKQMQALQLDLGGEYLLLAATLLNIKSKMLLPNEIIEADAEEEFFDPREDLVKQLLLHEYYQKAAVALSDYADKRSLSYTIEAAVSERQQPVLADEQLDIALLTKAFEQALLKQQLQKPTPRTIIEEKYPLKQEIAQLKKLLTKQDRLTFGELLAETKEIEKVVTVFLALLELIKSQEVSMHQGINLGPITIQTKQSKIK